MTLLEKAKKNGSPIVVNEFGEEWGRGCPWELGLETEDASDAVCSELSCVECYAREYKPTKGTPTIKDSGERRAFDTGAVRDMAEGKGDMVSLPNAAILRLSKHYEAGATKYGRWNYLKGLPVSSFMDSALRHLFKYLDGWDDEDHLAAAAFNVLGAMEMEAKHKELIDIPNREGKECFDYEG